MITMPLEYKLTPAKYSMKKVRHHIFTLLWKLLEIRSIVTPGIFRVIVRECQGEALDAF